MVKKWTKVAAVATTLVMSSSVVASLAACKKLVVNIDPVDYAQYTYTTYTTESPSNWNQLTYQTENDRIIMSYIGSDFFEFDYDFGADGKFKQDGSVNKDGIVDGGFTVNYSAATGLEDVTADYAEDYGWIEQGEDGQYSLATTGHAWKITLRNDLKWDDGTPIKAEDFVYSMKEQLNPLFKHYRAQEYYSGNFILHNAKEYVYQGSEGWFDARTLYGGYDADGGYDNNLIFSLGNSEENSDKSSPLGVALCNMRIQMGFPESYTAAMVAEYLVENGINIKADTTVEKILALEGKTYSEIKANNELSETFAKVLATWQTDPGEEIDFFVANGSFPVLDFEEVGIKALSDNELLVCYDNQLESMLNEDGTLAYGAGYYFSSLPLVKKDLYESCKQAPSAASGGLWTTTYNSSVATTASWGPYKLKNFETSVYFELVKNENWYGYDLPENAGQYQTDRIYYRIISEWNTAWQYFQKGGLDGIGIDVSISKDYKNSDRAYYTPDSLTSSVHFQSNMDALTKERGNAMLKYQDFRQALTLGIDRADYAASVTTSSQAGLGYFNDLYYYDVANGGVYRDTVQAKTALLNVYGGTYDETTGKWTVGATEYDDIDDAYNALTGYNLTEARRLIDKAYDEALAAGDIDANGKVTLKMGFPEDNSTWRRYYNYLNKAWTDLVKGTKLQGKLNIVFDGNHPGTNQWATDFIDNAQYDICCIGGWSGGEWNMSYIIGSYIRDSRYAKGWDPNGEDTKFTFTIKQATGEGTEDYTGTHTILEWYNYLNGLKEGAPSFVKAPDDSKLDLIAALEERILKTYWSCPMLSAYSASLKGFKSDYISYDYNTFMAYGGLRYMTYNYNDQEWYDYVKANRTLNYK